jgi:hypothetical protein
MKTETEFRNHGPAGIYSTPGGCVEARQYSAKHNCTCTVFRRPANRYGEGEWHEVASYTRGRKNEN